MTPEGYQQIKEALDSVNCRVAPEPSEGEDLPFVEVAVDRTYDQRLNHAIVLNLLAEAGLLVTFGSPDKTPRGPGLEIQEHATTADSMTFFDRRWRRQPD